LKKEDVDTFEKLIAQLLSSHEELSLLSKKSPNDAVNKFKLKFINSLLEQANEFLGSRYKPFADFSSFVDDELPQNSDVIFILAQYIGNFDNYKADNAKRKGPYCYWKIKNEHGRYEAEGPQTVMPKRLKI
jgi:hypothetical protein